MRRILLLIIAAAVAAYAGWYYWNLSQKGFERSCGRASAPGHNFSGAHAGL